MLESIDRTCQLSLTACGARGLEVLEQAAEADV